MASVFSCPPSDPLPTDNILCTLPLFFKVLLVISFLSLNNICIPLIQCPQTGGLKAVEMYSPTVLDPGSPKSRCGQGHAACEGSGEGPCLVSSTSGGGHPSLVLGSQLWLSSLCLCRHKLFSLCVCCHMVFSSSYEDTIHWMRAHPNDPIYP